MQTIPLTNSWLRATVSDEDYFETNELKWFLADGYAWRTDTTSRRNLSQFIADRMGVSWVLLDHKDRNRLNNQRDNLRETTRSLNRANCKPRSAMQGVRQVRDKWTAATTVRGKRMHLGTFPTANAACLVYNAEALRHFGEFAVLNPITEGEK